jgi:hypothetical protein
LPLKKKKKDSISKEKFWKEFDQGVWQPLHFVVPSVASSETCGQLELRILLLHGKTHFGFDVKKKEKTFFGDQ